MERVPTRWRCWGRCVRASAQLFTMDKAWCSAPTDNYYSHQLCLADNFDLHLDVFNILFCSKKYFLCTFKAGNPFIRVASDIRFAVSSKIAHTVTSINSVLCLIRRNVSCVQMFLVHLLRTRLRLIRIFVLSGGIFQFALS